MQLQKIGKSTVALPLAGARGNDLLEKFGFVIESQSGLGRESCIEGSNRVWPCVSGLLIQLVTEMSQSSPGSSEGQSSTIVSARYSVATRPSCGSPRLRKPG